MNDRKARKNENINHVEKTDESKLNDMWAYLIDIQKARKGDRFSEKDAKVNVKDFKLFVMTIFAIKGNKNMGVDMPYVPGRDEFKQLQYGYINKAKQLCFSKRDVLRLQKKFGPP